MARARQTAAAKTTKKTAKASPRARAPKLSAEAEELLDAANDASSGARNAWLAFLALVTYLLVTLAGISHRDLLLNDPVTLPIVNVEIPLFSFFQYAPVLLLLVLLSLLIQHVMLARKYRCFIAAIAPYEKRSGKEPGKEHPARERVHPYVVSQQLAGPKRNLVTRSLMRLMVFVTFALLPILTLLYFQVKFIPYHEVWVTYWHRIMLLLGLGLLIALLPIIQLKPRAHGVELGPQSETWRASRLGIAFGATVAILIVGFSWLIATVPDERLDRLMGFASPTSIRDHFNDTKLLNPLVRLVYDQIPPAENREDRGWLSSWLVSHRVLVVEDQDLVPDKDDAHGEVSVVLRGRNLQFARLKRSDLHRADLTDADLRGARMRETRLEKAKLERAQLQDASLDDAKLQGASLRYAHLQGADLNGAELQGADLSYAGLQGASLRYAELQGTNLKAAQLQGADLFSARLQGADLSYAELQGADLGDAELQGADLEAAELQSADLFSAELQGADLSYAELQGADLRHAELEGADLEGAKLQGADLAGARVWLVNFPGLAPPPVPLGLAVLNLSPPTAEAKAELKKRLQARITDGKLLARLIERLDPILRDDAPGWYDEDSWKQFIVQATEPSLDEFVLFLTDMACGDRGGHIVNSMAQRAVDYSEGLRYSEGEDRRQYAKPLAAALLDKKCEGAKTLTDEMQAELRELVAATE